MASKFGYVERGADSQVDWAEVSKGFSDKILGAQQRKQGRAQAVEDLTEVATNIDIPLGANTEWNTRAMEFAQGEVVPKIGNFKRMYDRGEISREKYMTILQRATQSTGKAMNLFENIQQQYAVLMKQSEEGKMSKFTQQNLDKINKFTDLNGMRLVMQDNGNVVANVLVPDGKGGFVNSTDPNDTASMEAIANIYMDSPDIYDASKNITSIAEGLGKFQYVFRELANYQKAGTITTVEDITKLGADVNVPDELKQISKKYLSAENGYIQEMMSNPQNLRSLLMDYVGEDPKTGNEYSVCDPGEDCKGSDRVKVFYNSNGQLEADITKEQKKVVENKIRTELRSKIDRTVDVDETGRIRKATKVKTDKPIKTDEISSNDIVGLIAQLWYGDQAQLNYAAKKLKSINPDIADIVRNKDSAEIIYLSGGSEPLPFFENGVLKPQRRWIEENAGYFMRTSEGQLKNIANALKIFKYDPEKQHSKLTSKSVRGKTARDRVEATIKDNSAFDLGTDVYREDFDDVEVEEIITKYLERYVGPVKNRTRTDGIDYYNLQNGKKLAIKPTDTIEKLKTFIINNGDDELIARIAKRGSLD